jgi:hypothetical protein
LRIRGGRSWVFGGKGERRPLSGGLCEISYVVDLDLGCQYRFDGSGQVGIGFTIVFSLSAAFSNSIVGLLVEIMGLER